MLFLNHLLAYIHGPHGMSLAHLCDATIHARKSTTLLQIKFSLEFQSERIEAHQFFSVNILFMNVTQTCTYCT